MGRQTILLLTLVTAMLLACAGVVLAQQTTTPDRTTSDPDQRTTPDSGQQRAEGVIPNKYIVVLRDDANPRAVASEHANQHGARASHIYEFAIKGYAAELPEQALQGVSRDPRVLFVEQDREVQAEIQNPPTGIRRVDLNSGPTVEIDGTDEKVNVDIGILDTGIDKNHTTELNIAGGRNCMNTKRPNNWSDGHGHGTHVSGTAAARDNSDGVVGMAPGARLWGVKVLDNNGSGTTSTVICGIDWVTGRNQGQIAGGPIEVANMSLSGPAPSGAEAPCSSTGDRNDPTDKDAEHRAICASVNAGGVYKTSTGQTYPGATYAVAAGNQSEDASKRVPARYDQVITVSNLSDYNGSPNGGAAPNCSVSDPDPDDTFRNTSNYGQDVDLGAPGTCIRSTYRSGGYATASGTSMASPHVAGAAALVLAANTSVTPEEVREALVLSANTEAVNVGHTDPSGKHPEPVLLANHY